MKATFSIAKIPIRVEIENGLTSIIKLFKNFSRCDEKGTKLKIIIKKADKNLVNLSPSKKILVIGGKTINNLLNPFNFIGILQATFRFAGIHSAKRGIFLVHGSAAIIYGNGVCFADDGKSTYKTTSAIECSLTSNKFIGDEFCFLDIKNKSIFSYNFIPLHIRLGTKNHLDKKHKNKVFNKIFLKTRAGYFIPPNKLFRVNKSAKIKSFVFVNSGKEFNCQKLNKKKSKEAIEISLSAHILKLIYPQLDRMRFTESVDHNKKIKYSPNNIKKIIRKLISPKTIDSIVNFVDCHKVTITDPCDLKLLFPLIAK